MKRTLKILTDVAKDNESLKRQFLEEALIRAGAGDPDIFRNAVDNVFVVSDDSEVVENKKDKIWHFLRFLLIGGGGGGGLGMFGMAAPSPFLSIYELIHNLKCKTEEDGSSIVEQDEDSDRPEGINVSNSTSKNKFKDEDVRHIVTDKARKEAFMSLPDKISNAFVTNNQECSRIVRETLDSYSPEEMVAVVLELSKKHRNLLYSTFATSLQGAERYELVLTGWSMKCSKDFKNKKRDNCRYYLYLRDSKGVESPVVFKHMPSLCIYVMYMLDRYQRKENVSAISILKMEKEFMMIYKHLMDETDENIKDIFKNMSSREGRNGAKRAGRYGEYIKDIQNTFETLLGVVDSIPFKVGLRRYLELPPEKMTIPKELAKLKIL